MEFFNTILHLSQKNLVLDNAQTKNSIISLDANNTSVHDQKRANFSVISLVFCTT
jgi:hypothetical protein